MNAIFFLSLFITSTSEDNEIVDPGINSRKSDFLANQFDSLSSPKKVGDSPCQSGPCDKLEFPCIECSINSSCNYGEITEANCSVKSEITDCEGSRQFNRETVCQYCYLSEEWDYDCVMKANCNSVSSPKNYYRTNCTVKPHIICLGYRTFSKNLPCNWTGGLRWSSALLFSLTLGGFGADRFYLGYWQEGIGKLFSFGGLGVWTIIDFVLIAVQYLGPADGSLYI